MLFVKVSRRTISNLYPQAAAAPLGRQIGDVASRRAVLCPGVIFLYWFRRWGSGALIFLASHSLQKVCTAGGKWFFFAPIEGMRRRRIGHAARQ